MDFQSLNDGCLVTGRCGRAGRDGVDWEAPRQYQLFVQKDPKGRNCVIAIRDRDGFAEFDPRYDQDDNLLITEDYYFEVTAVIQNPQ
ncbi:hypothetical protein WJ97_11090 [Burkholderia ubonensis]|uniref:hypothetical protein n=1 Tax=Burkholderia ubonensis TaxID=101571 RepID=UPI000770C226|nr:hypothetical protein [Burkholderia ubonensis]KVP96427.1 hypothetical protein WJ97_11090 [Burkholderia ubonensis]